MRHVHSRHRHHHSSGEGIRNRRRIYTRIPDQFAHLVGLELPQVHQFAAVHKGFQKSVHGYVFVQELSDNLLRLFFGLSS